MGSKIRIIVAIVLIVGAAYWAFDGVRQRSYTGRNLSFEVGNGHAVVTNLGDEVVPVEMRKAGRSASFRVESAELGLRESSKRQGRGRDSYHSLSFELPPGQATIDVTRGSGAQFIASSDQHIAAVVTPKSAESARMTLGFAAFVILGALYYISNAVEHRWIGVARAKLSRSLPRPKRTPA